METGEETENEEEEQEAAETQEKTEPPTKKFRQNKFRHASAFCFESVAKSRNNIFTSVWYSLVIRLMK